MKIQTWTKMGAVIVLSLIVISTAMAQSVNQPLIANIPFEFSAGNQIMPAGKYAITVVNPSSDQRALKLQSLDTTDKAMLLTHTVIGVANDEAKLVFNRYGDHYFLAQAWTSGDRLGMAAGMSKTERIAKRELVESKRRTETIALRGQ